MSFSTPIKVNRDSLKSLAGKTLIINGASSGIGLETAELFYELGCNVVFVGGRKRPDTYVPLDSPRTLVCQCDISSWESQVDVFEAAVAKFGQIDIVCANAGVAEPYGQYFDVKADGEGKPLPIDLRVFDVDMKGTAYTLALAFFYMRKKGGSVVIVSSMAGYGGVPEMPSYSASKHGAVGLLRSLGAPAAERNIGLSLLAPHITFTPGVFPQQYKRGEAEFQKMRQELLKIGIHLSSSLTCALATAFLVEKGVKASGLGLLIEDDGIFNLESALSEARPAWFVKKSENHAAREEYKNQLKKAKL